MVLSRAVGRWRVRPGAEVRLRDGLALVRMGLLLIVPRAGVVRFVTLVTFDRGVGAKGPPPPPSFSVLLPLHAPLRALTSGPPALRLQLQIFADDCNFYRLVLDLCMRGKARYASPPFRCNHRRRKGFCRVLISAQGPKGRRCIYNRRTQLVLSGCITSPRSSSAVRTVWKPCL